jgi:hypothetical protein
LYNSGFFLVEISPANKEEGVVLNGTISIRFSTDIKADSLSPSTLILRKVNGSAIQTNISYERGLKTVFIKPQTILEPGTQYQLEIVGGEHGILTITDVKLADTKLYEFTTAYASSLSSPLNLMVNNLNSYLSLSWQKPTYFNPATPIHYKIAISTSALDPDLDPGAVVWPLQGDQLNTIEGLLVNVNRPLEPNNYYAYVVAETKDHKSAWISYQFLVDSASPSGSSSNDAFLFEVSATYPEPDSVNIVPEDIKILFTDELNLESVSSSSVYVVKAPKPKSINMIDLLTKFSPAKALSAVIDTPMPNLISIVIDTTALEPNTEYTVVLRETIKSTSGSMLGEAYFFSFVSSYSPLFGDAERIRDDVKIFLQNVPDRVLYKYMHEASLTVLDVVSTVISPYIEEDFLANTPRYAGEYVRFQVGYDLVVNAMVAEMNGIGSLKTLGDLTVQPNQNISQVNEILKNLKSRIKPWEDKLHGHNNRGYAKPTVAIRGESAEAYPDFLTRSELTDPDEG